MATCRPAPTARTGTRPLRHDLPVLERGVHPLEREHSREAPQLLLGQRPAEVLSDTVHGAAELVGVAARADLEHAPETSGPQSRGCAAARGGYRREEHAPGRVNGSNW